MKLGVDQFYCVKCRRAVKVPKEDIKVKNVRSTRNKVVNPMAKAVCQKCGCGLNRFLKDSQVGRYA